VTPQPSQTTAARGRPVSPAAWAARCGLLAGAAAFLATNWVAITSGAVRAELSLLEQALVGYRFTFAGSLVGLAYGFMFGFCAAYYVVMLYHLLADPQEPTPHSPLEVPNTASLTRRR
jgi:hypothetical protein